MIINLFNPPQHAESPGRVRSALVWNDLARRPVYNSTKMHELDVTKEPSLPPSLFSFFLHPPIPLLSGAWPRSALLQSSAAAFGKINRAIAEGQEQKATSGELRGEVWMCLLLLPDPSQWLWTVGRRVHTYTHSKREDRSLCVCGSGPGNGRNVEG